MNREKNALQGLAHLRSALECFRKSGNERTAARIRKAISSAKGAVRHACHLDMREAAALEEMETDLGELIDGTDKWEEWDGSGACPKCQGDGCDPEGGCIYDE